MIPPGSNGLYIRNLGIKHLNLSALKAGGTLPPLELIKIAGVDMNNPESLRNGIRRFGKVLEELESAL
jgi:oligoendopeptidase F